MRHSMTTNLAPSLPESLARQMAQYEHGLKRTETLLAASAALLGLLLSVTLLMVSDRFWDTPVLLRVLLTAAAAAGCAALSIRWLDRWWWNRRGIRDLARNVQRHHAQLGDRLLGAVELANGENLPPNVSPALCRAAVAQVAREAEHYDFTAAVPRRGMRRTVVGVAAIAALLATAAIVTPPVAANAWRRWFLPTSQVPRFTFVRLADIPAELVVPHGEPFELRCRLESGSWFKPARATCRMGNQPRLTVAVENGYAVFRIPGQTRPEELSLRVGDDTRSIRVDPMHRPELASLRVAITYPSYLCRGAVTQAVEMARHAVLDSATIRIQGHANRALGTATLGGATETPLKVQGSSFESQPLQASDVGSRKITWTDTHGLSCPEARPFAVVAVPDRPPEIRFRDLGPVTAILEDETLRLEIEADDDFGTRSAWLNWTATANVGTNSDTAGTRPVAQGGPDRRSVSGSVTFSPIAWHIQEDSIVTLCAGADDYHPSRKPSASPVHRVYVLSRAKHAKFLEQQFQAVQSRLEEATRRQEHLLQASTQMLARADGQLKGEKTQGELRQSEQGQAETAAELKKLAEEMRNLIREAMRNKDIPSDILGQWGKMSEAMRQAAEQPMDKASQALSGARASENDRRANLDKARKNQEEALASLRKTMQKLNSSIEDMVARSFVNRLKQMAGIEGRIGGTLRNEAAALVGVTDSQLTPDQRLQLGKLSDEQTGVGRETRYLANDLEGFYARTRQEQCQKIVHEIKATNAIQRLDELAGLIRNNVIAVSIGHTDSWKEQFLKWATLLEQAQKKGGGEGGGGEGEGEQLDPRDLEVLVTLIRARQREERLREQTRTIDEERAGNKTYGVDAKRLGAIQDEIAKDVRGVERLSRIPEVRTLAETVVGEMMNASMYLRRPQTDGATIAIETAIIEMLSSAESSCAGSCKGSGMAMLMPMLGMARGASAGGGGGNPSPYASNAQNAAGGGNANGGGAGEARTVERAAGRTGEALPREFRDAIEAYFNAVENQP